MYKCINMVKAINNALDLVLQRSKNPVILGKEILFGRVFRCTDGLHAKYGPQRIIDTPICEQGILGFGIGLTSQGTIIIAEIQFADYIFPAFDQIINEATKYRYRSADKFNVYSLTICIPCGAIGH